jgi:hypothetical protein
MGLDPGTGLLQPVNHKEPKTSVISVRSTLCGVAFSLVTNTSLKVNAGGINYIHNHSGEGSGLSSQYSASQIGKTEPGERVFQFLIMVFQAIVIPLRRGLSGKIQSSGGAESPPKKLRKPAW